MAAAAHTPGGYGGVPQSVGHEFNQADAGSGILSHHALGGGVIEPPWFIRREASEIYHPTGFLHSATAGRADQLPRSVAAESHVMPADVVAGLGQGNSLAGAKVMDQILKTGPYGTGLPRGAAGAHLPKAPAPMHLASGGQVDKVPVSLSGGEYVLSPEQVAAWGGGDIKKGHEAIDRFINAIRAETIKKMRKLPPPKRG